MTNGEKFKEIFGFTPDHECCIMPDKVCVYIHTTEKISKCDDCPFHTYFGKEYRPCFSMIAELDDGK